MSRLPAGISGLLAGEDVNGEVLREERRHLVQQLLRAHHGRARDERALLGEDEVAMIADLALELAGEDVEPRPRLAHVGAGSAEVPGPAADAGGGVEEVVEEDMLERLAPLLRGDVAQRDER